MYHTKSAVSQTVAMAERRFNQFSHMGTLSGIASQSPTMISIDASGASISGAFGEGYQKATSQVATYKKSTENARDVIVSKSSATAAINTTAAEAEIVFQKVGSAKEPIKRL